MISLFCYLVLFGVLHSLLADLRVKDWVKKNFGAAYPFYRLAYNLLFLLMSADILYMILFLQQPVYILEVTSGLRIIAILLSIAGVIIMLLSFASFDLSEFIGFSYLKEKEFKPEQLNTGGLYQYVRHPLYFGIFVLMAGLFLLQPTRMNLMAVSFLYFYTWVGAHLEEKKLVQIFGPDYEVYQKKVKMLIPYIL